MQAAQIYNRVKTEFDRLEAGHAEPREWERLLISGLEALMKCQALLAEIQRTVRTELDAGEKAKRRAEAKDALYYIDSLTALYQRIKTNAELPSR